MDAQRRTLDEEMSINQPHGSEMAALLSDLGYELRPETSAAEKPHGGGGGISFSVWHTPSTGSTNADLVTAARQHHVADGLVLIADHQRAGRGRQSRTWLDQPGSALLSSVHWTVPTESLSLVPLAVGLAVADAVDGIAAEFADADRPSPIVSLKWPNDVLVSNLGDRKLAGILAEATPLSGSDSALHSVVIGMGMNIAWSGPPPSDVADRAATLSEALMSLLPTPSADAELDLLIGDVLDRYLSALASRLERLDPPSVLEPYRLRCSTLGRLVRFETFEGVVEGTAVDVDRSGALVVADSAGVMHHLRSGDAHHI